MELLGLRRKTNQTNRSKMTMDASHEVKNRPSQIQKPGNGAETTDEVQTLQISHDAPSQHKAIIQAQE